MKCPQPVLKVVAKAKEMNPGDVLEVLGNCPTFSQDMQQWCQRAKKTLLFCNDEGDGKMKAQIQF